MEGGGKGVLKLTSSSLVVHGEIKLNAFLWPEKETVKIWNFGSGARSLEVNLTSEGWRKTVHRNGAYNFWQMLIYMSPEQTGRTTFQPDHRTDLYSLGITFFVVLTQSMPFAHNSPMEIVHSVLNRKIPSLTQVRADVPTVVSSIIEKLTSKVTSGIKGWWIKMLMYDIVVSWWTIFKRTWFTWGS